MECDGGCGRELGNDWIKEIKGAKQYCKECSKKQVSESKRRNPTRVKEYNKRYRERQKSASGKMVTE